VVQAGSVYCFLQDLQEEMLLKGYVRRTAAAELDDVEGLQNGANWHSWLQQLPA
jgi:hypothetical protein